MLSVIVPTLNRAETLGEMLASLEHQSLQREDYEVIVVDNGSTDSTADVVAGTSERLGNVRYVWEPAPGLHRGRHCGMIHASGEVLVFADDDIEPSPTWLEAIEFRFRDTDLALLGGNNLPKFSGHPPEWLMNLWNCFDDRFGRSFPPLSILEWSAGEEHFGPLHVWGCNYSIRKSVLLEAEGFHPDGMPPELIRYRGDGEVYVSKFVGDRGLRTGFDPNASVEHKVSVSRMDREYFRRRGYGQGISDSYSGLRSEGDADGDRKESLLERAAGWLRRHSRKRRLGSEANGVLDSMYQGYREGFAFHRGAYASDSELRAWVHRRNYLTDSVDD